MGISMSKTARVCTDGRVVANNPHRYMSKYDFHQIESFCNATMKSRNTIIEKWPWRLKLFPQDPGAQEEFEDLFGSGHTGCERYVEWQRKA